MTKLVVMLILCWVPERGELREAWRIEKQVTLEHCLTMLNMMAGGGKAGAITVSCRGGRTQP